MTVSGAPVTAEESPPRRLPVPVVAGGAVAVLLLGGLARSDPGTWGVPLCPFHALTGWDCPLCGSLRAGHALLSGDVVGAAEQNLALLVVGILALVVTTVVMAAARLRGEAVRLPTLSARAQGVVVVALLAFGLARNLPGVPFLGSGVG